MAKEINGFLKVWKPQWFTLDYIPSNGYCLNISLEVDNPFLKKRFLMDYGSPYCKDVPSSYHKLKVFVDKTLVIYKDSLSNYEKALERTQHKLEILHENPLSHQPGSHEYISLNLLRNDNRDIQEAIEIVRGNISFVEYMLMELDEIKQEFEINNL